VTYSPLGAGFLAGKYGPGAGFPKGTRFDIVPGHADEYFSERNFAIVDRLRGLSLRIGEPMVRLAMAWVLHRPMIDGVLVGSVYGLAAMGLTLIWGVMRVINLTHGAMIVLGMFMAYYLFKAAGLSPYEGIPIVVVAAFVVGVLIYWIAVDRVIGRPILMSLLATFACNMILIGVGTALWTTAPTTFQSRCLGSAGRATPSPAPI